MTMSLHQRPNLTLGIVRQSCFEAVRTKTKLPGPTELSPFSCSETSPEIIPLAVMRSVRFPLLLQNEKDWMHELGVAISNEAVWFWWNRSGLIFASTIRRNQGGRMRSSELASGILTGL